MLDIYICDIDGTLADNSHRSPYDESKVILDGNLPAIAVIFALKKVGTKVLYFSGRTDSCREDTIRWLRERGLIDSNQDLFMRKTGDNRSDSIIKEELYVNHVKDRYRVLGVFDDRLQVCRMWWSIGLYVFCCNQNLIEF